MDGADEATGSGFTRSSQFPVDMARSEVRCTVPGPVARVFDCRNIRAFYRDWRQYGNLQRNPRNSSAAFALRQFRTTLRVVEIYPSKEHRMGLDLCAYSS